MHHLHTSFNHFSFENRLPSMATPLITTRCCGRLCGRSDFLQFSVVPSNLCHRSCVIAHAFCCRKLRRSSDMQPPWSVTAIHVEQLASCHTHAGDPATCADGHGSRRGMTTFPDSCSGLSFPSSGACGQTYNVLRGSVSLLAVRWSLDTNFTMNKSSMTSRRHALRLLCHRERSWALTSKGRIRRRRDVHVPWLSAFQVKEQKGHVSASIR